MKTALRVVIHVTVALLAVVIFYVGLGLGSQISTAAGAVLWFVSGALFVGNLIWLILFLNRRREAGEQG